jgi:hypothetical protein
MIVVWDESALESWRRLSLSDARAVAEAVERWAQTGQGLVVAVDGEFQLFVGQHVVVMLVARDTLYIDRVRRA